MNKTCIDEIYDLLRYEKEFGEIKLPTAPQEPQGDGRTAMPFGTGNA